MFLWTDFGSVNALLHPSLHPLPPSLRRQQAWICWVSSELDNVNNWLMSFQQQSGMLESQTWPCLAVFKRLKEVRWLTTLPSAVTSWTAWKHLICGWKILAMMTQLVVFLGFYQPFLWERRSCWIPPRAFRDASPTPPPLYCPASRWKSLIFERQIYF